MNYFFATSPSFNFNFLKSQLLFGIRLLDGYLIDNLVVYRAVQSFNLVFTKLPNLPISQLPHHSSWPCL